MTTRTANYQPVGNYLEGLNYDPRNSISNLERVIGRLPNETKFDYVENQARTFGDLTELLLKRGPPVVKMQVTGLLERSYISPYTTMILPIRQLGPYESINFEWTELNFNPGFMPQVEMLGVGRYFTHNKTRRGARAVRRGAAVKIEAGFFMTPEGRSEWVMQIEQLATAISETNEYDVLLTLLQVPMRQEVHAQEMNGPYNHIFYGKSPDMSFEERLVLMRDMFGLVNKTTGSRGFSALLTNLKTIMKRNGATPDVLVVPPYLVGHYYHTNDDLWHYMSAGPQALVNREIAKDIGDDESLKIRMIDGLKIIDTHVYRPVKGARNSACDLLTVPVQIGEKYSMEINMVYRDLKSFSNYRSSARDIRIFNEEQSRIVPVHFLTAVANSFRWKPDSTTLKPNGLSDTHNQSTVTEDMFKNGKAACQTWGDVLPKYLPDDAIARFVETVKYNVFGVGEWDKFEDFLVDLTKTDPTKPGLTEDILKGNADYMKYENKVMGMFSAPNANRLSEIRGHLIKEFNTSDNVGRVSGTGTVKHPKTFSSNAGYAFRFVAATFLFSSITFDDIKKLHEADIFVPIDVVLCKPWMTYRASSVVMAKAGSETGETVIGQQRFNMSSNTQDGTIEGTMTYYVKAIVKNSRNVLVAPHIFIQSYERGNNTTFVTQKSIDKIRDRSGLFDSRESLIAMLVPYDSKVHEHNWIDYRGRNNNVREKFHESADFYSHVFPVESTDIFNPMETFVDYEDQGYAPNTICWNGHMEYGPDFRQRSFCQGHLGPNTYDQVNLSRKEGHFAPVHNLTFSSTSTVQAF
jgi:hypothetical protein